MRPTRLAVTCSALLLVCIVSPARALPNLQDTRLLSHPALGARHLAFVYSDDLWIADRDGKNPRRLTSDMGIESYPVISPDGKTIAFTAQYDGNLDVYIVPVEGGLPTRLTWHPGPDVVRGFTPDGKAVLFSSQRSVFTNRYAQLFTVPITGGWPTQLPIPNGVEATFSPDGKKIAYTPLSDRTQQWKHYRGGTHSRIWILDLENFKVEQIPQPAGRCNDLNPQWVGDTIFFRSDRAGEYNVFAYDLTSKAVTQRTDFQDFPVIDLGSDGRDSLVLEQAGYLHLLPARDAGRPQRLRIGVATDLGETRPRFVKGAKYIRNASISPSGARAVLEFRGEIVTVPAEKGDPRNLTSSPGVHERDPAWSPDGKSIAYFSDEGGEYRLHVLPADGKGKPRVHAINGAGFYFQPTWSPDGKKIAFIDNSQSLYWIDLESGAVKKIASEPQYTPESLRSLRPAWSPDSRWIVYALGNKAAYHTVYAYEVAADKSRPMTDGLGDAIDPVFDAGGKYLYFFVSTDAGPVNQWFAQSNADMRQRRAIYLAVLPSGVASPLKRESDEEKPADANAEKKPKEEKAPGKDEKKPEPPTVRIDFEGIDQRILALPIPAGEYTDLHAGKAGQLFYLAASDSSGDGPRSSTLKRFDLEKRKVESVVPGVAGYVLAADGKKALTFLRPETWSIVDVSGPPPGAGSGKLKLDAVEVRIDPQAEWPQIFDEAWRINRDYFYDPGMHGADWTAIKSKYAEFLPHLATRGDLDRVIRWMLSELAVGHSYLTPGERPHESKAVPGGLLGADFEIANGRYRFKKVYGGLNWNPELRSPLTVPGVDVRAGEYLLAVRGVDLRPPESVFARFENTAGKSIEITVGPNPDGKDSRTVTVEPLGSETDLRNRDWVEGNLRKVQQATGGRVGYVYVPNTADMGHAYFKRYFFPQADRDGLIIDERFNGGGQVADYYIDHLRRPFTAMWATRYGQDIKTPGAAVHGPKIMLIDETAGSGGDLLPWMFRKYKLGPLVGKRTWGGLVGILGYPVLMDGGRVTSPNLAIWTEDGFVVENEGVPPDVEVEQWPAEVNAGKDPQLEKAIELALKELEKNPPMHLRRPPFPVRVKK